MNSDQWHQQDTEANGFTSSAPPITTTNHQQQQQPHEQQEDDEEEEQILVAEEEQADGLDDGGDEEEEKEEPVDPATEALLRQARQLYSHPIAGSAASSTPSQQLLRRPSSSLSSLPSPIAAAPTFAAVPFRPISMFSQLLVEEDATSPAAAAAADDDDDDDGDGDGLEEQQEATQSPHSTISSLVQNHALSNPTVGISDSQVSSSSSSSSSSMSAQWLRRSLDLNIRYQTALLDQLQKIDHARQRNASLQRKLRMLITKAVRRAQSSSKTKNVASGAIDRKPASHFFLKDITEFGGQTASAASTADSAAQLTNPRLLPMNVDAIQKEPYKQKVPLSFKLRKWYPSEITMLKNGIVQQKLQTLSTQILSKYPSDTMNPQILEALKKEITDLKSKPPSEVLAIDTTGPIDWDMISRSMKGHRTAMECKLWWENEESPTINKNAWTKSEDKNLLSLATKYQGFNWETITHELGTHRSAGQCFKRYQRSLNTHMIKHLWTKEEDDILREAVSQYGERNWQQVANYLDGRTGQQCLHRWMKSINPDLKKGRWGFEEDVRLMMAVHAFGKNRSWIQVQQHVPGRTDVQCRERWCNVLDPELRIDAWTDEEDEKLMKAVEKLGLGKWSKIAEAVYPRTDNQCWRRWKVLNQDKLPEYRKKVEKRAKALVTNFVGRENERSTLTVDDLEGIIDDDEEEEEADPNPTPRKKSRHQTTTTTTTETETEAESDKEK